jgi:hypothetical protein
MATVSGAVGETVSKMVLDGPLRLGVAGGDGSLVVAEEGIVTTLLNEAQLADGAESEVTVRVAGGTISTGRFVAGMDGYAEVLIEQAGHISAGSMDLGSRSSGHGNVTVTESGSLLQISQALNVGGTDSGSRGTGILSVFDGAIASVFASGVATTLWNESAILQVANGGRFTSNGSIDNRGQIALAGGTIEVFHIEFAGAALLTGSGTVDARVLVQDPLAAILAADGPLALGDGSSAGFVNEGTLDAGAQTVTLNDSDGALLGNVSLAGGTLVLPSGGMLDAGRTLSGAGLIDGAVANAGAIAATGSGLSFGGLLTGFGEGITGSLLTFLDGGGFAGAGTIPVRLDADLGSVITATGNLTIGAAGNPSGITLDGGLEVGAHAVTLQDAGGLGLGSRTTIDQGRLDYAGGTLSLGANEVLSGTGRTTASLLQNGGAIAPGASAGGLTHVGAYMQTAGGALEMELGDHGDDEWDSLRITGASTLAGRLILKALPSFEAQVGDAYRILTFASRSGTFTQVVPHGFGQGVELDVVYGSTFVDAVVTATGPAAAEDPADGGEAASLRFTARATPEGAAFDLFLPAEGRIRLAVFDVAGRMVGLLRDGVTARGAHTFPLRPVMENGPLPSGVYFGRLETEAPPASMRHTARVVVLR